MRNSPHLPALLVFNIVSQSRKQTAQYIYFASNCCCQEQHATGFWFSLKEWKEVGKSNLMRTELALSSLRINFLLNSSSYKRLLALCAESEICISSTSSIETLSPSVLSTDERYRLSSPPLPGTGSAYNGVCQSSLVHSFSFIPPLSLTQFSISLFLDLKI